MHSYNKKNVEVVENKKVLILVLMEDALVLAEENGLQVVSLRS